MRWFKHSLLAVMVAVFMAIDVQAATLRSDQVTNSNAVPIVMNRTNIEGGTVRRARGTYTFTGSEASSDIVEMVNIPSGAIIIRPLSTIAWSDMGGTVTVDVGDVFDPDRYCNDIAMGSQSGGVGSSTTFEQSLGAGIGLGGTYTHNIVGTSTSDDTIDLTLVTVTTGGSGSLITIDVVYVGNN